MDPFSQMMLSAGKRPVRAHGHFTIKKNINPKSKLIPTNIDVKIDDRFTTQLYIVSFSSIVLQKEYKCKKNKEEQIPHDGDIEIPTYSHDNIPFTK
jgi:hypothetical protein